MHEHIILTGLTEYYAVLVSEAINNNQIIDQEKGEITIVMQEGSTYSVIFCLFTKTTAYRVNTLKTFAAGIKWGAEIAESMHTAKKRGLK